MLSNVLLSNKYPNTTWDDEHWITKSSYENPTFQAIKSLNGTSCLDIKKNKWYSNSLQKNL